MSAEHPALRHVVQRRNWVRQASGDHDVAQLVRLPGSVQLSSFDSEADALAEMARLEEQARRAVNPFACDGPGLHYQTSLDAGRLHDWLLDGGIDPPRLGESWVGWWQRVKDGLDPIQWHHLWKALDRVVFHEVVARPRRPVVHVVAEIGWIYNDMTYDPRPDGSVPRKAYRSRQKAEAERLRREREAREEYFDVKRLELQERLRRANPFTVEAAEVPDLENLDEAYPLTFEVIEVELDGVPGGES